jgi:hypothetical protein
MRISLRGDLPGTPRLRSSHLGRRTAAQRVRNALLPRRRAHSRRVADGDIEALALLVGLAEETDTATTEAVKGLRILIQPHGYGDLSSPCPLRVRSAGQCRDSQPLADSPIYRLTCVMAVRPAAQATS